MAARQHGRSRLFGNAFAERLIRTHPALVTAFWGPVAALEVVRGAAAGLSLPMFVAGAAVGLLFWSLLEYASHRFLLHLNPRLPLLRRLIFMMHGRHHEDPTDPHRNIIPLVVSIPIGLGLYAASTGLFPGGLGHLVFGFIAVGYLIYELGHYHMHQSTPGTRIGFWLRRYHLRHHYAREEGNFGVTSPLWDMVFGTRLPTPARRSARWATRRQQAH